MSGRDRTRRAFSLAEVIVVVVVTGILGAVLVGGFGRMVPVARQEAAVGKARILNAARCSYALVDPDAADRWAASADDAARFQLLVEAQVIDGRASDYLSLQGGYTLGLSGPVRGTTTVYHDGAPVDYGG
ncbi:hypothetical protein GALL_84640 [mine drainage metagenome]|uniref:Prepilin-type N-terminal cleavage/methylation domain-containing protein n=1 Tax=mine drainage metagenome TaxID=410659 RepID=A0A1J5SL87_9ZZZZ